MERMFITGGTGFVGARVVRMLIAQGRDVALLMRGPTDSHRIDDIINGCTIILGDLRDAESFREALTRYAPTAVLHLVGKASKVLIVIALFR